MGSQCCGTRGVVWGSVPCSRVSPQLWCWRWRERWLFTPPTDNSCQTWDSNPQPSVYKSDSLSIRPRFFHCRAGANISTSLWTDAFLSAVFSPLSFLFSHWQKSVLHIFTYSSQCLSLIRADSLWVFVNSILPQIRYFWLLFTYKYNKGLCHE